VIVTEVVKDIYHVYFKSMRPLAQTFLRFQESYESQEFRGKIFSRKEFIDWYKKNCLDDENTTGEFDYYDMWGGFNIPSRILKPFYQGKFNPLSVKETQLLDALKSAKNKRFYVIGTYGNNNTDPFKNDLMMHEIAHGLYYTKKRYKEIADEITDSVPPQQKKIIFDFFINVLKYHPNVLKDELHAYLMNSTDLKEIMDKKGIKVNSFNEISSNLKELFKKYYEKYRV